MAAGLSTLRVPGLKGWLGQAIPDIQGRVGCQHVELAGSAVHSCFIPCLTRSLTWSFTCGRQAAEQLASCFSQVDNSTDLAKDQILSAALPAKPQCGHRTSHRSISGGSWQPVLRRLCKLSTSAPPRGTRVNFSQASCSCGRVSRKKHAATSHCRV